VTRVVSVRTRRYRRAVRVSVPVASLLAVLALGLAGCGGGEPSADEAATETTASQTTTTTETTAAPETQPGNAEPDSVDEDAPSGPKTKVCQEVLNQGSPLNIAASNGDFVTVVKRWTALKSGFPADVLPQLETLIEGYEKIAANPSNYGLLDTSPYKEAFAAVNAWTATACAQS
jgi:hypothetical protein